MCSIFRCFFRGDDALEESLLYLRKKTPFEDAMRSAERAFVPGVMTEISIRPRYPHSYPKVRSKRVEKSFASLPCLRKEIQRISSDSLYESTSQIEIKISQSFPTRPVSPIDSERVWHLVEKNLRKDK